MQPSSVKTIQCNAWYFTDRWRARPVSIVAAAARRRPDIPTSTLNPTAVNPKDGDVRRLGRSRVRHPVPAVSDVRSPAWPRRRRRRAHDQVAQARSWGSHLHPAQPTTGARRRQLPGSYSTTGARVRGDQRHQGKRWGLVRVFRCLPSAHWRLKPEWHLGLSGCYRLVRVLLLLLRVDTLVRFIFYSF